LDKIYDVIIPNPSEMYIGYAHNYVEKLIFEDKITSDTIQWPDTQRAGK